MVCNMWLSKGCYNARFQSYPLDDCFKRMLSLLWQHFPDFQSEFHYAYM